MVIYTANSQIKKGKTVGIFSRREPRLMETHRHDFIEIVYVLSGKGVQYVDGEGYEVKRGDILFINIGSEHSFEPIEDFVYVNISVSPEVVGERLITSENAFSLLSLTAFGEMQKEQNGTVITFCGEERREIEDILASMEREYYSELSGNETVIECYMNILITKMLRKTQLGIESKDSSDIWNGIMEYIDDNLSSDLTLSALAQKCFYNPSYFSRVFKQKFGTSLTEYVRRKRVERAVELISRTHLSIEEIVRQTGFSDRSTFYHTFSKYTGKSPSDYRD